MKHKPILMRKIHLEKLGELEAVTENYFDNIIPEGVTQSTSSGKVLFIFIIKYMYVPVLVYFLLRLLGFDLYKPFGDAVINFFKEIPGLIQWYLLKEFS